MMEASRTSLTIMPAAFSVALESMTDLLVTENEAVFAPIPDKAPAKELRNALQAVVDQFAPRIGAEGALIVKNKINNLNSPTNRNQLIKPFMVEKGFLRKLGRLIAQWWSGLLCNQHTMAVIHQIPLLLTYGSA